MHNNTSKTLAFPVIDFHDLDNRFETIAGEVLEACKNVGFFCIVNHSGPTSAEFDKVFEMGKNFFELPIEKKVPYGRTEMKSHGGYISLIPQILNGKQIIYNSNKSEAFDLLPLFEKQNLPASFLDHKQELDKFYKGIELTVTKILDMISFALKLPPNPITGAYDYLSSRHRHNDPLNTSFLHIQHYPSSSYSSYKKMKTEKEEEEEEKSITRNNNKQKGNDIIHATHIDNTTFTLLSQKEIKGLQVEIDAAWVDIPIIQDAILVNIGSTLNWWTKGYLKPALHRVVAAPEMATQDRYSIGYFLNPSPDTKLANLPSPLIPSQIPRHFRNMPTDRDLTLDEYMTERNKRHPYKLSKL